MQGSLFGSNPSLPEALQNDLEELLTWDNNCYLTWVRVDDGTVAEGSQPFTMQLTSDGREFGLRLEFWIPEWMNERGVSAILPASLSVAECRPGKSAAVEFGMRRWSEVETSLPRVARTCARLMNELWGRTDTDDVLLVTIDYQEEQLETPFTDLPSYGR